MESQLETGPKLERPLGFVAGTVFCAVIFLVVCGVFVGHPLQGEEVDQKLMRLMDGSQKGDKDDGKDDGDYGHAQLETDPDIQLFIHRARKFMRSKKYDLAVRLLQRALDEGEHVMVKSDPHTYKTVSRVAEQMLASLPRTAFEDYQVLADAQAEALMERPDARRNPDVLQRVVQRYFLTPHGAEAAYCLACLRINQGKFVAAARLLDRVEKYHSEYPVAPEEFLIRLAFVKARLGNGRAAKKIWKRMEKEYDLVGATDQLQQLEQIISKRHVKKRPDLEATDWTMAYGGAGRRGLAATPALPPEGRAVMTSGWEHPAGELSDVTEEVETQYELMKKKWVKNDVDPATHVVLRNNRIWVSSPLGVQCFDKKSGIKVWGAAGKTPITSAREEQMRYRVGHRRKTLNVREFSFFNDHIGGGLSLADDLLLRVEGNWRTIRSRERVRRGNRSTYVVRRPGSYLTAYEADTGKVRWSVGGGNAGDSGVLTGCRFMNAPVPGAGNLLVTVERNDGLYICALDPQDGRIVWEEFLCAYTPSPQPPSYPVGVSVEGGEVYVATGKGLVFALSAATGEVYWARTYPGDGGTEWKSRRRGRQRKEKMQDGWSGNVVIPIQNKLLVLPTDAPKMFCFDRSNGKLKYRQARGKAEYPVGVAHGKLFVVGKDLLRAHRVRNGKVAWKRSVKGRTARPVLTGKYVMVPQKNHIRLVDARSGKKAYRVRVDLGSTRAVGNLYADGKRLVSAGMMQTSLLWPKKQLLARLNEEVKKEGDVGAYFARGKYFSKTDRYSRAVKDLREAYRIAQEDPHQSRFHDLQGEMKEIAKRRSRIHDRLAWFRDSFDRTELGPHYEVTHGSGEIENGHVRLSSGKHMLLTLNRKIPGNFVAEVDGWQHERPCDLTFKLTIDGPKRTVEKLYAQFGSAWNQCNYIQFSGNHISKSNDYLIEKGKKHHLKLVRIGDRLTFYVDDRKIVQYKGSRIPATTDTQTTLHLYGYGKKHFYDNLQIQRLDANGNPLIENESDDASVQTLRKELSELERQKKAVRQEMLQLREEGYGDLVSMRSHLLSNIMRMLERSPKNRTALVDEAKKLATTASQKIRLHMELAEGARKREDFEEAVGLYYDLLFMEEERLLKLNPQKPDLRVTTRLWSAGELAEIQKKGDKTAHKMLDRASRIAYQKMTEKKDVSWRKFYKFMRDCPREEWIIKAGRRAAREAEKQGEVALAELILGQMETSREKRVQVAAKIAMAELFERQGWLQQAYQMLKSVKKTYPDIPVSTEKESQPAAKYCKKALKRIQQEAKTPEQLEPPRLPDPPYKLLWKKRTSGYPLQRHVESALTGDFLDQHVILRDRHRDKLICKNIKTGETVWETSCSSNHGNFYVQGNVLFSSRENSRAISLITGKKIWQNSHGSSRRGLQRYRGATPDSRNLAIFEGDNNSWKTLMSIDKVTGRKRWRRLVDGERSRIGGTFGEYVYARIQSRVQRGKRVRRSVHYEAFDARSGKKVGKEMNTSLSENHLYRPTGAFIGSDGDRAAFVYPDGEVMWKTPWKAGSVRRMRPVKKSSFVILGTGEGLMLADPINQQIKGKINQDKVMRFRNFVYDSGTDTIRATRRIYKNSKYIGHFGFIDVNTGEVEKMMKIKDIQVRRTVWANSRNMLAMRNVRKRKGKRVRTAERYWCILRREDGEMVPGSRLPRLEDIPKKDRKDRFEAALVGDKIVLAGGSSVMVYAHDDEAEVEKEK